MPVPSTMSDLSTTASSNSPAGSENPISTDDFHRAIQAILRHTNAKGSDIASAGSIDLGAATGEFIDVTGTTTITALGTIAAGIVRTVRFTGALTLTHNATSLILPTSANITTANGDVAMFRSLGSGNWKCVSYIKQDGTALSAPFLPLAGGTMPGDITMSGAMMKWAKGDDVASATALPLITDGNYFDVTGTTTITSFNSVGVGSVVKLHFDGALTLTHHATDLILPSGANITTAAGDEAEFVEYASGDYRCTNYVRANGVPVSSWVYMTERVSAGNSSEDFTGIPSWVTEIEVMFVAWSTNGTSDYAIQLGDSGGHENTGYLGAYTSLASGATSSAFSSAFLISPSVAAEAYSGTIRLCLEDSSDNTWMCDGGLSSTNGTARTSISHGHKSLSATLDRVRWTTAGGVNTSDGGVIRVRYR